MGVAVPFSASGWHHWDHTQLCLLPSSLYRVGELEAVWRAQATRPLKISTLARKQGLNTLKSTAQWTWINIIGAHSHIQACQDANVQAINCFSLTFSVVLFDIRGDYQLYYLYLAHLLVEQAYTEANTPRIGAAISEEHQVHFRLRLQQPHDPYTCGSLYVQQSSLYPSPSSDYQASTTRNTIHS